MFGSLFSGMKVHSFAQVYPISAADVPTKVISPVQQTVPDPSIVSAASGIAMIDANAIPAIRFCIMFKSMVGAILKAQTGRFGNERNNSENRSG